jgi:hypothetical protein
MIITLTLLLLSGPCPSRAFQASAILTVVAKNHLCGTIGVDSSALYSSKNGAGGPSQKRVPKKPRFTQSAAAGVTPPPLPRQAPIDLPPRKQASSSSRAGPDAGPAASRQTRRYDYDAVNSATAATPPRRPPAAVVRPGGDSKNGGRDSTMPVVNKERMWKDRPQSNIDDLEDRLSKRWGTDLRQWTASDDFDDADDEEEDIDTDDNGNVGPKSRYQVDKTLKSASVPARPVQDPWLTETVPPPPSSVGANSPTPPTKRLPLGAVAKAAPQQRASTARSPLAAFGGGPPKPAMDLSHLIADTPVAGGGSSKGETKTMNNKKKKRVVEKLPIPLTRNGEPLYLTCDQAARFFREQNTAMASTKNVRAARRLGRSWAFPMHYC